MSVYWVSALLHFVIDVYFQLLGGNDAFIQPFHANRQYPSGALSYGIDRLSQFSLGN